LMGLSLWLLWDCAGGSPGRRAAVTLFLLQLALNAAWSPIFFTLHQTRAALVLAIVLAAVLAVTIATAWAQSLSSGARGGLRSLRLRLRGPRYEWRHGSWFPICSGFSTQSL
jgi:tryptophan-rich sensory protein